MARSYCDDHRKYAAGCPACRSANAAYRRGPAGDYKRRYALARQCAVARLAHAHPEEYRQYLNEELDARTPVNAS